MWPWNRSIMFQHCLTCSNLNQWSLRKVLINSCMARRRQTRRHFWRSVQQENHLLKEKGRWLFRLRKDWHCPKGYLNSILVRDMDKVANLTRFMDAWTQCTVGCTSNSTLIAACVNKNVDRTVEMVLSDKTFKISSAEEDWCWLSCCIRTRCMLVLALPPFNSRADCMACFWL